MWYQLVVELVVEVAFAGFQSTAGFLVAVLGLFETIATERHCGGLVTGGYVA